MSKISHFGYSSTSSFDSMNFDKESLGHQLDRLNHVIQAITYERLSPEGSRHMHSPSIESFYECSKTLCEDNEEANDDIYKGIENFLLEIDRALMIREDFRSIELRKFEFNQDNPKRVELELTLEQLDLVLKYFQDWRNDENSWNVKKNLNVGSNSLTVVIKNYDFSMNKGTIANFVSCSSVLLDKTDEEINLVPDTYLKDLYSIEFINESLEHENLYIKNDSVASQIQFKRLANQKLEHQRIMNKLEWQLCEYKLSKDLYDKKINEISENERKIFNLKKEIYTEEYKLHTQKILFLKDIESIFHQKKVLETLREENQKRLTMIKNVLDRISKDLSSKIDFDYKSADKNMPISKVPRTHENKFQVLSEQRLEIDFQIQLLQIEIEKLESALEPDGKNSECVQTKIDRLKTQQSNLRTMRVMNASMKRTNFIASRLKSFQHKKTQDSSVTNPVPARVLISSNKQDFKENQKKIENKNKLEEFEDYIKSQEKKLIEKEQELNKRETMLMKTWVLTNSNTNLVELIQNEQRNLNLLRKDLEKRQQSLEKESQAFVKHFSVINSREKELNSAIELFNNFISEQINLENKLQILFNFLENIGLESIKTKKSPS